jgi:hypothetical protein
MNYEQRLTIPKNTPRSAPAETTLYAHPGVLQRVSVYFPPGPSGLAHVSIWYWERQLWPANPDSDFIGDDLLIDLPEDLELVDPPFEFVIRGWNEDDTYPHTPIVRLQIVPFDRSQTALLEMLVAGQASMPTLVGG